MDFHKEGSTSSLAHSLSFGLSSESTILSSVWFSLKIPVWTTNYMIITVKVSLKKHFCPLVKLRPEDYINQACLETSCVWDTCCLNFKQ